MAIPNPHDLIFKQFYGNPQAAAEFLRHNLPPDMAKAIDFSTITPVRDSFVSQDLQACFADLIFSCTLAGGAPGSIYLLFEHKSARTTHAPCRFCCIACLLKNSKFTGRSKMVRCEETKKSRTRSVLRIHKRSGFFR